MLEEMRAAILLADAKMSAGETKNRIALEVPGFIAFPKHVNAGEEQEHAEDGKNPVEARDEHGAGRDHEAASDERAKNAPGEDAMLYAVVDLEGAENDEEDKEIVNTEGFFDDVAGEEFHASLGTEPVPDEKAKTKSEANPEGAKEHSFSDGDLVGFAMKDTQIEGERKQNK
jgi:hypothetical protein